MIGIRKYARNNFKTYCTKNGLNDVKIAGDPIKDFCDKKYEDLSKEDKIELKRLALSKIEAL